MKHQNSKELKNPSLDKLLELYERSKIQDEIEIKKNKDDFIKEIKKFNKSEIKNSIIVPPKNISLWKRIKKTLGIG